MPVSVAISRTSSAPEPMPVDVFVVPAWQEPPLPLSTPNVPAPSCHVPFPRSRTKIVHVTPSVT